MKAFPPHQTCVPGMFAGANGESGIEEKTDAQSMTTINLTAMGPRAAIGFTAFDAWLANPPRGPTHQPILNMSYENQFSHHGPEIPG